MDQGKFDTECVITTGPPDRYADTKKGERWTTSDLIWAFGKVTDGGVLQRGSRKEVVVLRKEWAGDSLFRDGVKLPFDRYEIR